MGMFDYVEVLLPVLPHTDDGPADRSFQTKDLDRGMQHYRIDAEGYFQIFSCDVEETGKWERWELNEHGKPKMVVYDEEPPPYTEPMPVAFGGTARPQLRQINKRWNLVHNRDGSLWSGVLRFYTTEGGQRYEYLAAIQDSQVIDIERDMNPPIGKRGNNYP